MNVFRLNMRERDQLTVLATGSGDPEASQLTRCPGPDASIFLPDQPARIAAAPPGVGDPTAAAGSVPVSAREPGPQNPRVPNQMAMAKRPVSQKERRLAAICAFLLLVGGLAITPVAHVMWPPLPGFTVAHATGSVILDLLVALLLVSRAQIEHDNSRLYLAAAYFYAALVIIPHIASFPDTLAPGFLIGSSNSAIWLWVFWHVGFAGLVICYGISRPRHYAPRPLRSALLIMALAAAASLTGLVEARHLPVLIEGRRYFFGFAGHLVTALVLLVNLSALLLVCTRLRDNRGEDLWLAVGMIGACMDVWLIMCSAERFSVGWFCGRTFGLTTTFVVFVSLMNDLLQTYKRVAAANLLLDHLTITDPLTKLGNRRIFDSTLENEWRRCRRDLLPLSVLLFDVDHFKSYNDTYGHLAGDACLGTIAKCLRDAASRAGDLATRFGGEEFALILPATDSGGAAYVANMVRLTVRDAAIPHSGSEKDYVTISAGVATLVPSESFDASELVKLADQALYRAKASGRDMVAIAG
jgi:diguanylate cyclase (GGDEF)-like protein